jgi:hypothetical protein
VASWLDSTSCEQLFEAVCTHSAYGSPVSLSDDCRFTVTWLKDGAASWECGETQTNELGQIKLLNWKRQAGTNLFGVTKELITDWESFRPHCLCPDPVV